jgi:NAD(P)-dependent dehydrogenase (short-subunit alcohol dehydrogenase family)
MDFAGQHIVITGASSGIGRATAQRIVAHQGTVSLIARSEALLAQAVRELGDRASYIVADVGRQDDIIHALDRAVARNGPLDGLFLNAATTGMFGATADYTDAAFEEVMRVNVHSPFWSVRHVLPAMMARGSGAILVSGSLASERGMVGNTGYLISKHAVLGLARAIAMEAASSGVRCNCVEFGFIDTKLLSGVPADAKANMAALTPQRRIGTPDEAASVAAFLLSDDASHVTAQAWAVDGGLLGTLAL